MKLKLNKACCLNTALKSSPSASSFVFVDVVHPFFRRQIVDAAFFDPTSTWAATFHL